MARSAGSSAQLVAKEGDCAQVKLPSGEMRRVTIECYATVGQVGNLEHENVSIGKAGRNRWLGWRPHNRGVAMNPVDHPHRRRRGQDLGRPPSGDAVGPADQGLQDAQQQAHRQVHRRSADRSRTQGKAHGAITQEGTVHRRPPAREDRGDERGEREEGHQDLVAPLDRRARDGRPHDRGAQREEVHPGVHHREHGRATSSASSRRPAPSRATRRRPRRPRRWRRPRRAGAGGGGGAKAAS